MHKRTRSSSFSPQPSAFTLVELLVVIGIIAVLISILFPVIGKIREAARETDTRALVNSLESACQQYYADFNAYPGPLPTSYITALDQVNYGIAPAGWRNSDTGLGERIVNPGSAPISKPGGFNDATVSPTGVVGNRGERVTEAENMVLGLLGGVSVNKSSSEYYLEYDATTVGKGAASLNPVKPGTHGAYMQLASLSAGKFKSGDGQDLSAAKDSRIPEYVDRWPDPMPILVLRARIGGRALSGSLPASYDEKNNNVVVNIPFSPDDPTTGALNGQYNLVEITPYTQSSIGTGRKLKQSDYIPAYVSGTTDKMPHGLTGVDVTKGLNKAGGAEYVMPFDGFSYLADPSTYTMTDTPAKKKTTMKARKTDNIILISAGKDRVFGTADDITNFGSVLP